KRTKKHKYAYAGRHQVLHRPVHYLSILSRRKPEISCKCEEYYSFFPKYSGRCSAIHANTLLMTEPAPTVLARGPYSIMRTKAYCGFSYGKNPAIHEFT